MTSMETDEVQGVGENAAEGGGGGEACSSTSTTSDSNNNHNGGNNQKPPSVTSTSSSPNEAIGSSSTSSSSSNNNSNSKPGIMGGNIRGSLRSRKREGEQQDKSTTGSNGSSTTKGSKAAGENDSQGSGPSNKRSKSEGKSKQPERWRAQRMVEDYVNLVGDLMYPKISFGPYGNDLKKGEVPLERPNTLGVLMCPARRITVIERWSPYEIACFEGAITLWGKNFYEIHKIIKTKSTKEVIEFYYMWKMTSHYQQWKRTFEALDPHPFHIAAPEE